RRPAVREEPLGDRVRGHPRRLPVGARRVLAGDRERCDAHGVLALAGHQRRVGQLARGGRRPRPGHADDVAPLRLDQVLEARELEVDRARFSHRAGECSHAAGARPPDPTFVERHVICGPVGVTLRPRMSRSGPAQPTRAGRLLDVERFERVAAPGATALLRLNGRLHTRARVRGAALALLVDDGQAVHRFVPLPAPGAVLADRRLTVAFAVPVALLSGAGVTYAIELSPRRAVALRSPAFRTLRPLRPEQRVRRLEDEVRALRRRAREADGLLAELDRLRTGITELSGRARQTDGVREELASALARVSELEAREEQARRDSEAAWLRAREEHEALEGRLGEAVQRHAELESERAGAREERAAVEQELAVVRERQAEADAMRARAVAAAERVAELEVAAAEASRRADALAEELAAARADAERREHRASEAEDREAGVASRLAEAGVLRERKRPAPRPRGVGRRPTRRARRPMNARRSLRLRTRNPRSAGPPPRRRARRRKNASWLPTPLARRPRSASRRRTLPGRTPRGF